MSRTGHRMGSKLMADAMTAERLAEIRRYATRTRTVKDLLAECDRLAAENEWLRDWLTGIAALRCTNTLAKCQPPFICPTCLAREHLKELNRYTLRQLEREED